MPFVKLNGYYSNYELQSGVYNLEGSIGYQFAIIFEKMLSKNISLEAGAGISRILFDYSVSGIDNSISMSISNIYNQNLDYIDIPVLARYYFNLRSFKPYLEGGINGRFLINSMEKSDDFWQILVHKFIRFG